ncbi:hypothetical protein TeGR_g7081, partial [Tetraparma gracilis]
PLTPALLSVIYGNRAACYMMCRDYSKAASDCETAYGYVLQGNGDSPTAPPADFVLAVKLGLRRARAETKRGECVRARDIYKEAVKLANDNGVAGMNRGVLDECLKGLEECKQHVDSMRTLGELAKMRDEAGAGKKGRLDDVAQRILKLADAVLAHSPASLSTVVHKVRVLADTSQHAAAVAAVEKHAKALPYNLIPSEKSSPPPAAAAVSAAVAVLLPASLLLPYVECLRLDDRGPAALAALGAVESREDVGDDIRGARWQLAKEKERIRKVGEAKEAGDAAFRKEKWNECVEEYSTALNVDSDLGKSGKIHAVIRCNRAAGYMALRRFREAARDCTAALNIAPDYRKGLLRRARCHARLKLYKESLADYESWVAGEIGAGGRSDEIDSVKKELEEVRKAIRDQQRETDRNKWFENNFGSQENPGYDRSSFRGYGGPKNPYSTGPHRGPHPGDARRRTGSTQHGAAGGGGGPPPFGRRNSDYANAAASRAAASVEKTHYQVLGVSNTADATAIKKAYHKLALMYHPDKNKDEGAADLFRKVQGAYEVVGGDGRRKYDSELLTQRFRYR